MLIKNQLVPPPPTRVSSSGRRIEQELIITSWDGINIQHGAENVVVVVVFIYRDVEY